MILGTVAFCAREDHVAPQFTACLARLMAHRGASTLLIPALGGDVAQQRNAAVRAMQGDWIWFIDADQVFAADALDRLLAHGVDVVQGLCLLRHPPHPPILHTADPILRDPAPAGPPRLVRVQTVGAGGTLYRRAALDRLARPWFVGTLGTEDLACAAALTAAGVPLWCDLATPIGHLTPTTVWPHYADGEWSVRYEAPNGRSIYLP